jgi:hypothetical protein
MNAGFKDLSAYIEIKILSLDDIWFKSVTEE